MKLVYHANPCPKYVGIRNRYHTGRVDKYISIVLDGRFSGSEPHGTSPASMPEGSAYGTPPTSTFLLHYQAYVNNAALTMAMGRLRPKNPIIPEYLSALRAQSLAVFLWRSSSIWGTRRRLRRRRQRRRRECGRQDQATGAICQEDNGST